MTPTSRQLAVAGAGGGDHHGVTAVRHQLRRRPRQVRRVQPLLECEPAVVDQRGLFLVGARQRDRRVAVPRFLQQDSRRADQRLAMEPACAAPQSSSTFASATSVIPW